MPPLSRGLWVPGSRRISITRRSARGGAGKLAEEVSRRSPQRRDYLFGGVPPARFTSIRSSVGASESSTMRRTELVSVARGLMHYVTRPVM